jgi:hypothetical protein
MTLRVVFADDNLLVREGISAGRGRGTRVPVERASLAARRTRPGSVRRRAGRLRTRPKSRRRQAAAVRRSAGGQAERSAPFPRDKLLRHPETRRWVGRGRCTCSDRRRPGALSPGNHCRRVGDRRLRRGSRDVIGRGIAACGCAAAPGSGADGRQPTPLRHGHADRSNTPAASAGSGAAPWCSSGSTALVVTTCTAPSREYVGRSPRRRSGPRSRTCRGQSIRQTRRCRHHEAADRSAAPPGSRPVTP